MSYRRGAGPFYDTALFPFVKHLTDNWRVARDEALALADSELVPYPVRDFYRGTWQVLGFRSEPYPGQRAEELAPMFARARQLCPRTAALCRDIPGSTLAGFSILEPGCEVLPHSHDDGQLIVHVGLVVPEGCGIEVEGERRAWREGEALVFDEKSWHSAWNRGTARRIVLLADFDHSSVR